MRSDTDDRRHPSSHTASLAMPTPGGSDAADCRLSLRRNRHAGSGVANRSPRSGAPTASFRAAGEAQAFSYANMPQALADELRSQAERIRRGLACHTAKIIEIGNELRHAKGRLPHGSFLAWAEQEIGISARAAQLYMRASAWIMNRDEKFSRLPISTIYLLAARTTPGHVADEFSRQIAMDAPVTYVGIRQRIKAVRQAAAKGVTEGAPQGDRGSSRCVPETEESLVDSSVMEAVELIARCVCAEDLDRLQRLLQRANVYGRLGFLGRQLLETLKSTPKLNPL
jgi:hypothetical protein